MTAALADALRACAAGLYPDEAGTELLIHHGCFLHRPDFAGFIHAGTSITDGTTPLARIDWDAAVSALRAGVDRLRPGVAGMQDLPGVCVQRPYPPSDLVAGGMLILAQVLEGQVAVGPQPYLPQAIPRSIHMPARSCC